jgi:probable rRNA maturation factor
MPIPIARESGWTSLIAVDEDGAVPADPEPSPSPFDGGGENAPAGASPPMTTNTVAIEVVDAAWHDLAVEDAVRTAAEAALTNKTAAEAALTNKTAAEAALTNKTATPVDVSIALVSDAESRELNRGHRGQDKPTNVLSFPVPDAIARSVRPRPLGDIVLARGVVVAEATDAGLPIHHHVSHLVVHGCLHLLGFDHETDEQAEAMEAIEIAVLADLGIPNPYTRSEEDAR